MPQPDKEVADNTGVDKNLTPEYKVAKQKVDQILPKSHIKKKNQLTVFQIPSSHERSPALWKIRMHKLLSAQNMRIIYQLYGKY